MVKNSKLKFSEYRTCAIITLSLYKFYPIFEGQKHFLRSFFHKIQTLCTVSIQELVLVARVQYMQNISRSKSFGKFVLIVIYKSPLAI